MNSAKKFMKIAATNILSWKQIDKELVGIVMAWGAYLMLSMYVDDPAIKKAAPMLEDIVPLLFWPTVIMTGVIFAVASIKSALPAMVTWVLIVPLYLLGFTFAAQVFLTIANASTVIYVVGFLFLGGRRIN